MGIPAPWRRYLGFLAVVLVVSGAPQASAQTVDPARLEQFLNRLDLREEQKDAARPVIVAGLKERLGILKSAGFKQGEKPSVLMLLKVRGPIRQSLQRTEKRLSNILNPVQMNAYRQYTEEARNRFRAGLQ
jgi:hypothetical protein